MAPVFLSAMVGVLQAGFNLAYSTDLLLGLFIDSMDASKLKLILS